MQGHEVVAALFWLRLIAASAMLGGVAIFYLSLRLPQGMTVTGLVVFGVAAALYLTRHAARDRALAREQAAVTARN